MSEGEKMRKIKIENENAAMAMAVVMGMAVKICCQTILLALVQSVTA